MLITCLLLSPITRGQDSSALSLFTEPPAHEGELSFYFQVRRTGNKSSAVNVSLKITSGGGPPGSAAAEIARDFEMPELRIAIPSGETVANVFVPLVNDGFPEPDEFLTAELVDPSEGTRMENSTAVIRIVDNDQELPAHLDVSHDPLDHPLILFREEWVNRLSEHMTNYVHPAHVTYIPLGDGGKLAFGHFTHVNGVRRPYLARLDALNELDPTFTPEVLPRVDDFHPITSIVPLSSEKTLLIEAYRLRRLNKDGSADRSFKPEVNGFPIALAVAPDETLWVTGTDSTGTNNVLLHVARDGGLLNSRSISVRVSESGLHRGIRVQPSGHVVVGGHRVGGAAHNSLVVKRFLPDGSDDTDFAPVHGELLGMLPDGRLAVLTGAESDVDGAVRWVIQVLHPDGAVDSSFPPAVWNSGGWSWIESGVGQDSQGRAFLTTRSSGGALLNGLRFGGSGTRDGLPYINRILLTGLPRTALHVFVHRPVEREPYDPFPVRFQVTFRRLGSLAKSATVHFATRDITTSAEVDYVPLRGTLAFAPLEAEKVLTIPVLADDDISLEEWFELVVTGGEGIEALPAPLLLRIRGDVGSPTPYVQRIKRIADGRILLGGDLWVVDTGELKPARIEFSSDLRTWQPLKEGLGGSMGPQVWLDASATNAAMRYYRAVLR